MKIKEPEILSCTTKNLEKQENFNILIEEFLTRVLEFNSRMSIQFENNCSSFGCDIFFKCDKNYNQTNHDFNFLWTKDGGELPNNSFLNENDLKIFKIKKINLGNYTCSKLKNNKVISNSSINIYEQYGFLKFKNIPKISFSQKLDEHLRYLYRSSVLELGSTFAIECLDLCNQLKKN